VEDEEAGEVVAVSAEAVALVAEVAVSAEAVLQGDGRIIRIQGSKGSGIRVKFLRIR